MSDVRGPGRVFISYAHDHDKHVDEVRNLYRLLRCCGIDAELDLPADERREDWALWMLRGIRDSRRVILVGSPEYKRRADGDAGPGEGAGVQWEARLLRSLVYDDPVAALDRIIPVVLPGGSANDLPSWLGGRAHTHYAVDDFTVEGAQRLLRLLTGQPYETVPVLGTVPVLAPREAVSRSAPRPPLRSFVLPQRQALIDALLDCPTLHRLASRHELLELMGGLLGLGRPFAVPESTDTRTHLRSLCGRVERTTLTADAVLKAMYLALEETAPDDIGTRRVRELLVASGLVFGEE